MKKNQRVIERERVIDRARERERPRVATTTPIDSHLLYHQLQRMVGAITTYTAILSSESSHPHH